jgi:phosphoribosylanthranilate isomerase
MSTTRIKICCIQGLAEARRAVAAGAHALGLVGPMPSGPGALEEEVIAATTPLLPPAVDVFLLTSATDPRRIIAQQRRCGAKTLQLVAHVPPTAYPLLRASLPGVALVQVVHVEDEGAVAAARALDGLVQGILLDSGRPRAPVPELGGTGRIHDWELSRRIVETVDTPVLLAGGLTPENVEEAVARVQPFGVDVCGGVRTEGRLDPTKLEAFVAAVRTADAG